MPDWELIAKYLAGEATQIEKRKVELWLNSNPENKNALRNLEKVMRPGRTGDPDFTESRREDWMRFQEKLSSDKKVLILVGKPALNWWFKVAASILVIAVAGIGGIWFTLNQTFLLNQDHQFMALDSVRVVSLPDNSRVWLNKHSRLVVSKDFEKNDRKVTLEGEAYFEVVKDAGKPFILISGKVTTQVVGTAFNVNLETDGSVKVTVTKGKVSVFMRQDHPVFLTAGEVALYNGKVSEVTKLQNSDPNFMAWKTGIIRFESVPLKNVLSFLSKHYDTDIRLINASLEKYSITTVLDNIKLDEALVIIATTLNLKFEKKNSIIYFMEQQ